MLGEIRLGVSHLRGVSEQPGVPPEEDPCPEQADGQPWKCRVLIAVAWRGKFNREKLKGKANLLPQHTRMGQVTVEPRPRAGMAQNRWDLICKTSAPRQDELVTMFSLLVLGQLCSFIDHEIQARP